MEGHWFFFSKKPLLLHFWFNILIISYSLAGRNGVFLNRMRALLQDTLSHSPQFTSFIVLVVGARGLHRNTAARSPPACLAFAVPTLLPHGALAVSVAQVWTAVCKERTGWRGRGTRGRGAGCFIIGGTQNKAHVLARTRTHTQTRSYGYDRLMSLNQFNHDMVARCRYWLLKNPLLCAFCRLWCARMDKGGKESSDMGLTWLSLSLSHFYLLLMIRCI